jgi:restriction system protein
MVRKYVAEKQKTREALYIKSINGNIDSIIKEHIKALALKRKQTVKYDDYGNVIYGKWLIEIDYFINHVLSKDITIRNILSSENNFQANNIEKLINKKATRKSKKAYELWKKLPKRLDIHEKIKLAVDLYSENELLKEHSVDKDYNNIDIENLTPFEFEHYCADILKANGWKNARVTQASGDQGIDIVAEYGDLKAVFQCKKYSSPVGNKAVQEIIAGKQFSQADIASVVSNVSYTQSAKQLAQTTGVHLLHYSELRYFSEKL